MSSPSHPRPRTAGKFLALGDEKLIVRGVTYGTFGLHADGSEIHLPATVDADFAAMAANGINAVRLYTVPPRWLLDVAQRYGLLVMIGLPWEQHVDFLADADRADAIEERVRAGVRSCANHPAVLCFSIGNEIPAPIVRWLGATRVERFIERLFRAAKDEDPEALVTYVNFPSTEYLNLPFLDFISFNVYLETQERLESYLARLHNLAGDRPVLMGEIGLDSRRNGEEQQGEVLDWQVRTAFAAGCAGTFVFAWTDEWHRGGHEIDDWDFGLTTRDRHPKPALAAVRSAFADVPIKPTADWPRISVVCCTFNGTRTIGDTLDALARLDYPNYETIVVDDGSTLDVHSIVQRYDVRYVRTDNMGLSSARNTGMLAATGEIVAYVDDDAFPDQHWLTFLAAAFRQSSFVGVGGPNIPLPNDGLVADCVANAPGGPIHVLLDDREAEHIPGCNMSFRRSALLAIGGFDVTFRIAGDDVDLCWRLQARGWKIGFCPAAMVWHHRRNSVRAYLRQQRRYGSAEALLERKWPEKYNTAGHIPWAGRIYATYLTELLMRRGGRIYHGTWGSALFQSVYQPAVSSWRSLLMMPEYYLVIGALSALSGLGMLWYPLLLALPLLVVAVALLAAQATVSAWGVEFPSAPRERKELLKRRALTALLHLAQPIARLYGRATEGLTPWRRVDAGTMPPTLSQAMLWSERWAAPETRLEAIEDALRAQRAVTLRGGDFDRWDLEVRGGMLGGTRMLTAVEEHGAGRQLTRVRMWPHLAPGSLAVVVLFAVLAVAAGMRDGIGATVASAVLGTISFIVGARLMFECSSSMGALRQALAWIDVAQRRTSAEIAEPAVARDEPVAEGLSAAWSFERFLGAAELAGRETPN